MCDQGHRRGQFPLPPLPFPLLLFFSPHPNFCASQKAEKASNVQKSLKMLAMQAKLELSKESGIQTKKTFPESVGGGGGGVWIFPQ